MKPDHPLNVGDRVTMRKPHPCGSLEWTVTRVGADIGLRCVGCGRRILLTRSELSKQAKTIQPVSANSAEPGEG